MSVKVSVRTNSNCVMSKGRISLSVPQEFTVAEPSAQVCFVTESLVDARDLDIEFASAACESYPKSKGVLNHLMEIFSSSKNCKKVCDVVQIWIVVAINVAAKPDYGLFTGLNIVERMFDNAAWE